LYASTSASHRNKVEKYSQNNMIQKLAAQCGHFGMTIIYFEIEMDGGVWAVSHHMVVVATVTI
jgi:hypothetical protein